MLAHWLSTDCDAGNGYCGGADINRNGAVTLDDAARLFANWLKAL